MEDGYVYAFESYKILKALEKKQKEIQERKIALRKYINENVARLFGSIINMWEIRITRSVSDNSNLFIITGKHDEFKDIVSTLSHDFLTIETIDEEMRYFGYSTEPFGEHAVGIKVPDSFEDIVNETSHNEISAESILDEIPNDALPTRKQLIRGPEINGVDYSDLPPLEEEEEEDEDDDDTTSSSSSSSVPSAVISSDDKPSAIETYIIPNDNDEVSSPKPKSSKSKTKISKRDNLINAQKNLSAKDALRTLLFQRMTSNSEREDSNPQPKKRRAVVEKKSPPPPPMTEYDFQISKMKREMSLGNLGHVTRAFNYHYFKTFSVWNFAVHAVEIKQYEILKFLLSERTFNSKKYKELLDIAHEHNHTKIASFLQKTYVK